MAAATSSTAPAAADGEAGGRDPFVAYVLDADSHAAAMALAESRGWSQQDIVRGDIGNAMRLLSVAAPPQFMLVDLGDVPGAEALEGIAELARSGSRVVALGSRNDVGLYRSIVQAGADDYLVKPVDRDTLSVAFARVEVPSGTSRPSGRRIGFLGVRGGIGATTLVENCAWLIAERLSRRVLLIDLDPHYGDLALRFDAKAHPGLREALESPDRVDPVFIGNASLRLGRHLSLLAAEEPLDSPVRVHPDAVRQLLDAACEAADVVLVDVPRALAAQQPQAFASFDALVLVLDPTLSGLRDACRLLRVLRGRHAALKVHVAVSQRDRRPALGLKEIARGLEADVDLWAGFAGDALRSAEMTGEPVAKAQPGHPLVRSLADLAKALAGVREAPRRRLLTRLLPQRARQAA